MELYYDQEDINGVLYNEALDLLDSLLLDQAEQKLFGQSQCAGAIFYLKNKHKEEYGNAEEDTGESIEDVISKIQDTNKNALK